jgi:pyruvate/2-oxoglutarate dehydrogenase complex dihydrolipoamide acyltransferase (E2) component
MNSCLSFDHRILDGAQALRFLKAIKRQLETVEYPLY